MVVYETYPPKGEGLEEKIKKLNLELPNILCSIENAISKFKNDT